MTKEITLPFFVRGEEDCFREDIAMKRSTFVAACRGRPCLLARRRSRPQTDWPTKPITFVVPYPPGGLNDAVARVYRRQA